MSMSLDDQVKAPSIGSVRLFEHSDQLSGNSYASGQPPSIGSVRPLQHSRDSDDVVYDSGQSTSTTGYVRTLQHSQVSPSYEIEALSRLQQLTLNPSYMETILDGSNNFASQQHPGGYVRPYQYQQHSEGEFTTHEITPETSYASNSTQESSPTMSVHGEHNNLSFVDDLNPAKGMWYMKARIIRKWNQGFKVELILIDEKGAKIQACIKSHLIYMFDPQVQEDAVVILSKFGVSENKDQYKVVKHDYKINFYHCTTVRRVDCWEGAEYGFKFTPYKDILRGEASEHLTVDVAGSVIWCGALDVFERPPKETKRINLDIQDLEGTILRCTLWNNYAEQLKEFISKNTSNEHVMAVIQHAKVKEWKEQLTVQSNKFGTRLFLNEELDEVNQLRRSLILKQGQTFGSTSQTILSSQTVYPLHQEFIIDYEKKHVDELSEIETAMSCVVVATIKIVQENYGWFYVACRKCSKKVLTKTEYLQKVENDTEEILQLLATALICPKCNCECTSITTKFKVQVRVQDETGSVSFVLFNRDVMRILGLSASDIRERQVKANDTATLPHEVSRLVEKKLAFKIEVSEYNLEHDYHVYTVHKICDDQAIIAELVAGNDNVDENGDEVSQQDVEIKDVNLSESSQAGGHATSKDVVSVTTDSSAFADEKDSAISTNGKRTAENVDTPNVGELFPTTKRTRKSPLSLHVSSL